MWKLLPSCKNKATIIGRYLLLGLVFSIGFTAHYPETALAQGQQSRDISKAAAKHQEVMRASRLARQAESDGDLQRALDLWDFILENKPGYYSAYHGMKRCLIGLERFDEALAFLDEMLIEATNARINIDPMVITADRIEVLFTADRQELAETEIEKAVNRFKGKSRIYQEVSGVLSAQGLSNRATEILLSGREDCRNPYLFARNMARWAEARMDWKTAVSEYLLYLEESPKRLTFVIGALGDLAIQPAVDSLTLEIITRRIEDSKTNFSTVLQRLLAALHFRSRRYSSALEHYQILERIDEGQGKELLKFATMIAAEGEFLLAWQAFNEILLHTPAPAVKAEATLGKGFAAESIGEVDTAVAVYREIIASDFPPPSVFEAYRRLGMIEIEYHSNPSRARNLFELASKLAVKARQSTESIDGLQINIARTWAMEGDLDRAEKILESLVTRAGRRRTASADARFELMRFYFWRGRIEDAEKEINSLMLADPASDYANESLSFKALFNDLNESPDVLKAFGSADLLLFLGDVKGAGAILDSISGSDLPRAREHALWKKHEIAYNREEYVESLTILNDIINSSSAIRKDLALYRAGEIVTKFLSDPRSALTYFEEILIQYPESPLADKARRRLKELEQEML